MLTVVAAVPAVTEAADGVTVTTGAGLTIIVVLAGVEPARLELIVSLKVVAAVTNDAPGGV
jgi:hypothetical protein